MTCSTIAPSCSSTVGLRAEPGADTAKPVAFSTTAGGASAKMLSSVAMETGSFRLETNTGSGLSPLAMVPAEYAPRDLWGVDMDGMVWIARGSRRARR